MVADGDGLHILIAGAGDPYAVLDETNRLLLLTITDDLSLLDVAAVLGLAGDELEARLQVLRAASLVHATRLSPGMLIARAGDAAMVAADAAACAEELAELVVAAWPGLERTFRALDIGQKAELADAGLLLVGGRALDLDLLNAFARQNSLLPAPPPRPAPGRPDDRYYIWMIDGPRDWRGRYGGGLAPLPWPGWVLHSFGRLPTDAGTRAAQATRVEDILTTAGATGCTPRHLAEQHGLALLSPEDALRWEAACLPVSERIVTEYEGRRGTLQQLHRRIDRFGHSSLSELVCWHVHLTAGFVLDQLIAAGLVRATPDDLQLGVVSQPTGPGPFMQPPAQIN